MSMLLKKEHFTVPKQFPSRKLNNGFSIKDGRHLCIEYSIERNKTIYAG